ncbi:hypothetical protein GCM10023116_28000 [Kistimonas scapharcae]|uniref:Uncharacterized protein n=1 Tax=Kistimonas scapharcae TaxID=1036133 RepID=A0ABP8V3P6_9GAMM
MEEAIKRILLRLFPELKNGYHKPMLGRVERIANPPKDGGTCTHDDPLYAVDIQPLDAHFRPRGEVLRDLVVAVPYAGQHRGFFALPDPGCIVEFCFSYALPHLVHIRGVIPWGLELPAVDEGEAKWQHSQTTWQGYDTDGNWRKVGKIHENIAAIRQLMKSPKTWLGSDKENVLKILSDFMETTAAALTELASHTHRADQLPTVKESVEAKATTITQSKTTRLDPITE